MSERKGDLKRRFASNLNLNKCFDRSMEVELPAHSLNFDRLTDRPTDQPTDRSTDRTDRRTHGEVLLLRIQIKSLNLLRVISLNR